MDVQTLTQLGIFVAAAAAAYIAARRAGGESRKIIAESDLIRVETQAKIIDDLQAELERHQTRIAELERQHLEERIEWEKSLAELKELNLALQKRISALEG